MYGLAYQNGQSLLSTSSKNSVRLSKSVVNIVLDSHISIICGWYRVEGLTVSQNSKYWNTSVRRKGINDVNRLVYILWASGHADTPMHRLSCDWSCDSLWHWVTWLNCTMDHMIWSCDLSILWITWQSSTRGVHNGKVVVRDRWEIMIRGSMAMGRWGDNNKGSMAMGRHWDSKARGELNYYW